ncbi:MAG: TetR/AcrR family transcriptional regulator C-terminal domain-containing protein [Faecalibacterium sp.]|nr:TetR/AcrR family transcriptional regulator C-terminal domain-containing protein [Faecalibacterium sp.]
MSGANRTKQALAESMKALMKKMPLEKISVSDIVEHAHIGRNTFYYHFQDKFDLVNWIFQSESSSYFVGQNNGDSWNDWMTSLSEYFAQNREFYCKALAYAGQNSLRDYLFDLFKELTVQRIKRIEQEVGRTFTAEELNFGGEFMASALLGLLVRWAEQGMKPVPAAYSQMMLRLQSSESFGGLIKSE